VQTPIIITADRTIAVTSGFFRKVYGWMTIGLGLTALVALYTVSNPELQRLVLRNNFVFIGLILAELGLVIVLSAAINRLSATAATTMFCVYAALNGLTISAIFLLYTRSSIASTFFITAGTFGAMSLYGYATKKDLSSWGSFLFMGLIGIILASVVNIFLHSEMVTWVVSCIGVLIFTGLTAYDTNQLKTLASNGFANEETANKTAVIGALKLYLDFINLFLMLLRLLGSRD
jgi:hypothetical protein